jgi:hypothetical protein
MFERHTYSKRERVILLVLFLAIWAFLWIKAVVAPMSHDEVATFFYFVQNHRFLPFFSEADANNHILNSALTTFFYSLFGPLPVALRLASLLSYVLYFLFTIKLSTQIKNALIRWAFVIVFSCSSGMIEFFALSRGYGMSMALLLGSLYYLMLAFQNNQFKYYLSCLFLALLALLANLTLLVTFLIIFVWLLLLNILKFEKGIKRNSILIISYIVLALIPLLGFLKYIFLLQNTGALYYGSLSGFWTLTVHTLSYMFTGFSGPMVPYVILFLFVFISILFVLIIAKEKIILLLTDSKLIFFILLCGNIAAIIYMGRVMRVNYPEDRTGLYLFPFFIGSLCFLLDRIIELWNKKWALLFLLPLLFFPLNFIYTLNFSRCNVYIEDRFPERYFDIISAAQKSGDFPATVGGNSVKLFCWTYFNYCHQGTQGAVHYWNFPSTDEEYQIVRTDEIPGWKNSYDSIDYDKHSRLLLLKRKIAYTRVLLDSLCLSSPLEVNGEYLDLCQYKTDSLLGKTLYLGYKLNFSTAMAPFNSRVVIDVCDKDGKSLVYEYICLNWLKLHYSGKEQNFINGMLIHKIPPEAASIKSYIWNLDKATYLVKGSVYLFSLAIPEKH